MAAAARPGPSGVPCPVCGGLVHPIAGKCKHCKSDLRDLRGPRPAAAAPLPSLGTARVASPHAPSIMGNGKSNGHAVPPPVVAVPVDVMADSKPILPPRVTQQRYAASGTAAPERSVWRSWPVIVIILAVIAIIAAIVLMIWPHNNDVGTKRAIVAPPDRMNTDPLPQAKDPTPPPPPPPAPPPPADPWPDNHAIKPDPDPLGGPQGRIPDWNDLLRDPDILGTQDPKLGLFLGLGKHICTRAKACGNTNMTLCDALDSLPAMPMPACPAAQRCVEHADRLGCGQADPNTMNELFQMFPDCEEAARC